MAKQIHTAPEFETYYNESINGKALFVKFYSNSCKPCKRIQPLLIDLTEKYNSKFLFLEVNVDKEENDVICSTYDIQSLPTMVFLVNGAVAKIVIGSDESTIKNVFREVADSIKTKKKHKDHSPVLSKKDKSKKKSKKKDSEKESKKSKSKPKKEVKSPIKKKSEKSKKDSDSEPAPELSSNEDNGFAYKSSDSD